MAECYWCGSRSAQIKMKEDGRLHIRCPAGQHEYTVRASVVRDFRRGRYTRETIPLDDVSRWTNS